jgi:hypothetical protein
MWPTRPWDEQTVPGPASSLVLGASHQRLDLIGTDHSWIIDVEAHFKSREGEACRITLGLVLVSWVAELA